MKKLRFSGLPPRLKDEAALRTLFSTFGKVEGLTIDTGSSEGQRGEVSGRCRFAEPEVAALTLESLNGLRLGDYVVRIERDDSADVVSTEDSLKRAEEKRKKKEAKAARVKDDAETEKVKKLAVGGEEKTKKKASLSDDAEKMQKAVEGSSESSSKPKVSDVVEKKREVSGGDEAKKAMKKLKLAHEESKLAAGSKVDSVKTAVDIKPRKDEPEKKVPELKRQISDTDAVPKKKIVSGADSRPGSSEASEKKQVVLAVKEKAVKSVGSSGQEKVADRDSGKEKKPKSSEGGEGDKPKKPDVDKASKSVVSGTEKSTTTVPGGSKTTRDVDQKVKKASAETDQSSVKKAKSEVLSASAKVKPETATGVVAATKPKSEGSSGVATSLTKAKGDVAEGTAPAPVAKKEKDDSSASGVTSDAKKLKKEASSVTVAPIGKLSAKIEVPKKEADKPSAPVVGAPGQMKTSESVPAKHQQLSSTSLPQEQQKPAKAPQVEPLKATDFAKPDRSASRASEDREGKSGQASVAPKQVAGDSRNSEPSGSSAPLSESIQQAAGKKLATETDADKVGELWEEYFDESYGVPYYYNPATELTTWNLPPPGSRIVKGAVEGPAETRATAETEEANDSNRPDVEQKSKAADEPVRSVASRQASSSSMGSVRSEPTAALARQSSMDHAPVDRSSTVPTGGGQLPSPITPVELEKRRGETVKGTITHVKTHFGFIRCHPTPTFYLKDDMFFHFNELISAYPNPKPGDEVEFELGFNNKRRQPVAVALRLAGMKLPTSGSGTSHGSSAAPPAAVSTSVTSSAVPVGSSAAPSSRPTYPASSPTASVVIAPSSRPVSGQTFPSSTRRDSGAGGAGPSPAPSSAHGTLGSRRARSRDRLPSREGSGSSRPPHGRRRSRSPALRRQHSGSTASQQTGGGGAYSRGFPRDRDRTLTHPRRSELDWKMFMDRTTNRPYWYCASTQETTWDDPFAK